MNMNNIVSFPNGGVAISTIPSIPDQEDDSREARAHSSDRGEQPGTAVLRGDVLADLYRVQRELGANRVSVAVTSEISADGSPEVWYCVNVGDIWESNRVLSEVVAAVRAKLADTEENRKRRIVALESELAKLRA